MKNTISLVLVSSLIILASSAFSDERPHQGMGGMGQSSGMMMQGSGMGQSSGMMMQGGGKGMMDMNSMQERIKSMQQLMDRMGKTNDPAKRRTMLREHMEQMQKLMGDMHGMMGAGMMGDDMSMEDRQRLMNQRMDMMQQMMEQMLEQQSQMMK